jgi:hypothetical protein
MKTENTISDDGRLKWWRESRFGMFIHFGLYSQDQDWQDPDGSGNNRDYHPASPAS